MDARGAAAEDAGFAVQPPREPHTLGEEVQGLASAVWDSLGGRRRRPVVAPPPRPPSPPPRAAPPEAADSARQLFLDALQKVSDPPLLMPEPPLASAAFAAVHRKRVI